MDETQAYDPKELPPRPQKVCAVCKGGIFWLRNSLFWVCWECVFHPKGRRVIVTAVP